MRDRWDEEEEELGRGRDRARARRSEPEPEREPTVGELIDSSVRKLVTGMVIAGALIGLGVYGSGSGGGSAAPEYQITTSADGRTVYRVNTDSGSIVACRDNNCWLMQRGNRGLDDDPRQVLMPHKRARATHREGTLLAGLAALETDIGAA